MADTFPDYRRRRMLQGMAAVVAAPLAPTLLLAVEAVGPEQFRRWSEILLGWPVDDAMAASMFDVFSREPWGMDHMRRLRRKLIRNGHPDATALNALDEGERWFLEHLLTTWLTGIYYHQRGNRLISYEHALMHAALEDIRPVPGLSDREFGFWAEPPGGHHG